METKVTVQTRKYVPMPVKPLVDAGLPAVVARALRLRNTDVVDIIRPSPQDPVLKVNGEVVALWITL